MDEDEFRGKVLGALGALAEQISTVASRQEALGALAEQISTVASRQEALAEQVATVVSRQEALAEQISTVASRQEALAEQISTVASRQEALAEQIATVASRQEALAERVATVVSRLDAMAARQHEQDVQTARHEAQLAAIVRRLDDQDAQLDLIVGKIDRLQTVATGGLTAAEQALSGVISLSRRVSQVEAAGDRDRGPDGGRPNDDPPTP